MAIASRRFLRFFALTCFFVLLSGLRVSAELHLPKIFSDQAVIQAGKPITIWGTARAHEEISVRFAEFSQKSHADAEGNWQVAFPARLAAYDELILEVKTKDETLQRQGILIGEVWLATGQSNMQWALKQSSEGSEELPNCADPQLRFLHFDGRLQANHSQYPRDFLRKLTTANFYQSAGWQSCDSSSAAEFSAVAYFFAKKLRAELNVPIGIVALAVGGSPIEAHLPRDAFEADAKLRPLLKNWWKNPDYPQWCRQRAAHNLAHWLADPVAGKDPPHPFAPTFLWQAGIEPLLKTPVRGVIWYQGESNATLDGAGGAPVSKEINRRKLVALIDAFRRHWKDEKLPFYQVQLPGLNRPWALFREMQLEVSRDLENVGLAVTIDLGHPTDVHPRDKKPVGQRLARIALNGTYDQNIVPNGPLYKRSVFRANDAVIDFDHAVGLQSADGSSFRGFEIAGRDQVFHPAEAEVTGAYLVVRSAKVPHPQSVRYAWANDPKGNLINGEKLPASPFRTDDWKKIEPSAQK